VIRASVLIVEDDARARASLRALLEDEGYAVIEAADGLEASELLGRGNLDAALLDIRMPGKDGLAVLRDHAAANDAPAFLVMTAFGNSTVAIEAMKLGAYDYLTKPLHFDEVLLQLQRAIRGRREARELEEYRGATAGDDELAIIGDSPAMRDVYKMIGQVAASDSTVLVRGESGTGKELVARAIHKHSRRREGPFVAVNCGAIPENLLESELFGHEKGAFTGAATRRRGKFEIASGGTVFLDEIAELSPATQVKLLRVLQEHTIERLGSEAPFRLDIRVIAATHRKLEELVASGEFREDVYYRLNVITLVLPPLRERPADIPQLAEFMVRRLASRRGLPWAPLTPAAVDYLRSQPWPGNVRELEHTLERALILSRGMPVLREHVEVPRPRTQGWCDAAPIEDGFHANVSQLERNLIERALTQAGGNRSKAAELLKINRRLLYDKMREFRLE
jgi:DNA-binding NtrC family response regulator